MIVYYIIGYFLMAITIGRYAYLGEKEDVGFCVGIGLVWPVVLLVLVSLIPIGLVGVIFEGLNYKNFFQKINISLLYLPADFLYRIVK